MTDVPISKVEIISVAVKLTVLTLGTFLTVKWMISRLDPTRGQKEQAKKKAQQQLRKIGVFNSENLNEYEMMIASHVVNPSDISVDWSQIAGLDETIKEIKTSVILLVRKKYNLPASRLTQPPKGVLLYGPPGCGKTMLAKAIAREAKMRFINLDVSILTDKWYGESQKLASAVFTLAVKLQPCIIFIDEIDSLLRRRNAQDHEATAMMKTQFMSLWDGLITDPDCTVIVMGATNRPTYLDEAFKRRMPKKFYIGLPNALQRQQILKLILKHEPTQDVNFDKLALETEGFSGCDLHEMCRNASVYRINDYLSNIDETSDDEGDDIEDLRPITMRDLQLSLDAMRVSGVQSETLSSIE